MQESVSILRLAQHVGQVPMGERADERVVGLVDGRGVVRDPDDHRRGRQFTGPGGEARHLAPRARRVLDDEIDLGQTQRPHGGIIRISKEH